MRDTGGASAGRPFISLLIVTLAGCVSQDSAPPAVTHGPMMQALASAGPLPRRWIAQLSLPTTEVGCRYSASADSLRCGSTDAPLPGAVVAVAHQAVIAARTAVSADALHATALIDLLAADTSGNAVDRSISHLEMLTRLVPRSVDALVDLSAAHLARAALRGDVRDAVAALDAATRAGEFDSSARAAHFNRALAMEWLGLDRDAEKEWVAYRQMDSTSRWSADARGRTTSIVRPSLPHKSDGELLDTSSSIPPGSLLADAFERVLPDWASAVRAGDSLHTAPRLAAARAIGATLAQRTGDSSVVDAVHVIEETPATRLAIIASVYDAYRKAQTASRQDRSEAADSGFAAITTIIGSTRGLGPWATLGHANALIYRRHPEDAGRVARALLESPASRRYPMLAARASWTLGVLTLRAGRPDDGLRLIRSAAQQFEQLGEREYFGTMLGIEGETLLASGDAANGYARLRRSLTLLREYPTSQWRHSILFLLARAAAADGFTYAASEIENEDAAATTMAGVPGYIVESRLARARALWSAGQRDRAVALTAQTARTIDSIPPSNARIEFSIELALNRAIAITDRAPGVARAQLDTVIASFVSLGNPAKVIPARSARARAALALGDVRRAEADLDSVVSYLSLRTRATSAPELRATILGQARSVFDQLVMLRLHDGRTTDALAMVEQRRDVTTGGSGRIERALRVRGIRGQVIADYAVIGDTLLAWVIDSAGTSLVRTRVGAQELNGLIERARAAFELRSPDDAVRPELAQLYDRLVRPIRQRIGLTRSPLVIVTDESLANVPFAALTDAETGSRLVETRAIRFAPTLSMALSSEAAPRPVGAGAVFVANPQLDRRTFPALAPLGAATAEARESASGYPGATVITGADADSSTVVDALQRASLFHFAGHAVFDDARPDRSYLAVSPRGLSASSIAQLNLHALRLAVLSGCETTRAPSRPSGGFDGLAAAFLVAGARGVVGSLWHVDDEGASALMTEFHRAYQASGDGSAALRSAQLALLRSPNEGLRTPAVWAAFRYVGH